MTKDIIITPENSTVEFYNGSNVVAEIKEIDGDLYLTATGGDVIFGDGTPANIEFGNVTTAVSQTFLGGGTISSNGNALNLGSAGDVVNLNVANVTYNLPSTIVTTSEYTAADVLTKIKTVDGAGSGLDADLLDGVHAASFLRSDENDTFSGILGGTGSVDISGTIQSGSLIRSATIVSNTWIHATQNLTVASSTASTTSATGAAVITGGVGIGGRLNAGGAAWFASTINAGGTAIVNALTSNGAISGTTGTFSANLAVDTNTFFVDSVGNKVGVLTTTPTAVLDVVGSNGDGIQFRTGTRNITLGQFNNEVGISWGSGSVFTLQSGGLERARVDSNGNVGIATATVSAGYKLQVQGSIKSTGTIDADVQFLGQSSDTASAPSFSWTGDTNVGMFRPTTDTIGFTTAGAERVRITSTGNVGIATTTVQTGYHLQVQGNSAFSNRVGIGTTAVLGLSNALVVYGSAMVYGNVDLANPTGGTSGIYFNDGSYQTTAFTGAATPSFGPAGTVQVAGAGNTFSGNGDSFFWDDANSRLGIGTNSPTNVLTVRSTATPAWFNTVNSAIGSNNYEIIVGNGTSTGTTVGYVNNTAVPYGYLSAGTATRNIIIAANGRVGIGGVTAPRVLLDVGGGTVIGSSWAGNSNFINPPTNGLSVQGSVGIGTYTPLNALDVRGGVGITAASNFGGAVSVASLTSNGAVSGTTGTFTSALYGASFNTGGTATVSALVSNTSVKTATVNASSTIVGANIYSNGFVQSAGTVKANAVESNTTITAGTGLTVTSGGVNVSGYSQFTGNVDIAGNLNVTGTINTQNANVLIVNDPIIYLGEGNTGNNWDLGLVGNYNDGVYEHTGFVRNHVTGVWTLFDTLPSEPNVNTGNVDWSNSSLTYAAFLVGNANVAGQTASISTTTGALTVPGQGGVGIGGRLNVGGAAWFASTLTAGGAFRAQSINSNTNVVGVNLQSTGQATVSTLVSNGAVSGTTGTFTSALYSASFNTAGTATVNALVSNGAISGTSVTFNGNITVSNGGTNKRGILGTAGDNDFWFFGGSATATNAGFLEIATGDDGTEPIFVRQYNGSPQGGTAARTLTLLDASGNSEIPGSLTIPDQIIHAGDTNTTIRFPANDTVTVETNGSERLRVDSNGNVGIATATVSAGYKLQVQGSVKSTGTIDADVQFLGQASDTVSAPSFSWTGDTNVGIYRPAADTIGFTTNGTERMRVDASGNVGIATATVSAGYKLQVQGSVKSTGTIDADVQFLGQASDTASAPSFSWTGDTNVGMYRPATDTIGFTTAGVERMRVDSAGNVGIGTSTVQTGYMLQVEGGFAAINKSFVINHPTKSGYKLQYASLEGPENGVYVRGRLKGESRIELPDYWLGLVDQSTITVNLTPIGHTQNLYVSDIDQNSVWIGGDSNTSIHCFYTVYAERKDIEKLTVEYKER